MVSVVVIEKPKPANGNEILKLVCKGKHLSKVLTVANRINRINVLQAQNIKWRTLARTDKFCPHKVINHAPVKSIIRGVPHTIISCAHNLCNKNSLPFRTK